jgi:hypothetical protein
MLKPIGMTQPCSICIHSQRYSEASMDTKAAATRWFGLSSTLLFASMVWAAQPVAGHGSEWLARAQDKLEQREYFVGENNLGLQAPNRHQGFRSYFDGLELRLVTRDADSAPLATWRLRGLGRGDPDAGGDVDVVFPDPGAAQVDVRRARVSHRWSGVTVDHVNEPAGLRQEITLDRRPDGTGPLSVMIEVDAAALKAVAETIALTSPNGSLRLSAIGAEDARGRVLPVAHSVSGQRLRLLVDDDLAHYPIRLRSLLTGLADVQLVPNQAGAQFGFSVAGAGDVNGDGFADVIVGAQLYDNGQVNEGAAFVYLGAAAGPATTADALLDSNQTSAGFGTSLAGVGDVNGDGFADILVSSESYANGESGEGAAFLYFGGSGSFDSTPDALLEANQVGARFGSSVAGAGDVNGDGFADVVVGARAFDHGQVDEGAAFVYFGGTGGFDATADALLESNQAGAMLGSSVAGAGDVNGDGFADLIVGAIRYDSGQVNEGTAFVYLGAAGAFDPVADAQLESNQADADFGESVAGAGDVNGDGFADVIVGAREYDNGQVNEGAAFVYFGSPGAFDATPDAQLESDQAGAIFGDSVAGAGDVNGDGFADVIIGAPFHGRSAENAGSAFVYLGGAGDFDLTFDARLDSSQASAGLGISVAGAGDVNADGFDDLIVGAWRHDSSKIDEGAAFVYFGAASTIRATPAAVLEVNQDLALLGASVAGAGDVNGDGFSDVIVGAPNFDNGQVDEGAAFIYLGGAGGLRGAPVAQLEIDQVEAEFGSSVAGAGDVNGDGFADVIVGAPLHDGAHINEGAAFIYYGGSGDFDLQADASLGAGQAEAEFGRAVAGVGDVNGDGQADVAVTALLFDNGEPDEGAAFVYLGGAGAFDDSADAQLEANQSGARFGLSVAGAGDLNGDGLADIIVGAPSFNNGQEAEGAVFVYLGGAGSFDATPDALLESDQAGAQLGWSVSGAGDVNGDGHSDLIAGAILYSHGQAFEGAALVYLGGAGVIDPAHDALLVANQGLALFGWSVAGIGDVNGDGYADVAVGALQYDNGEMSEGAVLVFPGGASGPNSSVSTRVESDQTGAQFGVSLAGAGDVNGDGFADVIVGSHVFESGQDSEGAAFVYHGGANGRLVQAGQYRGSVSVQPWGLSRQSDGFVAALQATSPRGRERVRMQLDACPSSAAFDSQSCNRFVGSAWTALDATSIGSTLAVSATGLPLDRVYHWRARVQYAPLVGDPPANPFAGPWRRLQANADVADIRTSEPLPPLIFLDGFE